MVCAKNSSTCNEKLCISKKDATPPNTLWKSISIALVLGVVFGLIISPKGAGLLSEEYAETIGCWVALPGHVFLAVIQMMVIPLIVSSIILGIAANDNLEFLKKIGLRIAPYFILTTCAAIIIGILTSSIIKPGSYIKASAVSKTLSQQAKSEVSIAANSQKDKKKPIPIRIANLVPTNPEKAISEKEMFQVVIYCIFMAAALVAIKKDESQPLLDVLRVFQKISMKIVSWAMLLTPFAVFGLLANVSVTLGVDVIFGMGAYIGTVILGLLFLYLFYILIIFVATSMNPLKFMKSITETQLLAFSTSSSAAVMPLTMSIAETKLKVNKAISQFIVPLGATVNMDGTALYQVSAAIFLTQVFGIQLSLSELILLALTTVGASIGTPSTPGVGIVILAGILKGIGVPAEGIFLIIGVDRILDMSRTAINVTGDLTACVVMNRYLKRST